MKEQQVDIREELSKFIFVSKYARYDKKKKRRETWEEAVDRVLHMHLRKFSYIDDKYKNQIIKAFDLVKEKKVVPSMRSLQFGGKAIEAKNCRNFNCSVRHVDSIRSLSEIFYVLLCGTGSGIGLTPKYTNRLPGLMTEEDKNDIVLTYKIEDTIEGWSDSLTVLLSCFLKNTGFTGRRIVFDYSAIRKKGKPLKTSGGKAPGPEGLKYSHIKIIKILDALVKSGIKRLKPIHLYDILMHAADSVLSGGIRRSACLVLFDKNDADMIKSKTYFKVERLKRFALDEDTNTHFGKVIVKNVEYDVELLDTEYENVKKNKKISWLHIEPQRARSNNSVLLDREKTTLDEFKKIIEMTKEYGEPGYVFGPEDVLTNPCGEIQFIPLNKNGVPGTHFCVSGNTALILKDGISNISSLVGKKCSVWNGEKWVDTIPVLTQKDVDLYKVRFNDGSYLDCTLNHRFIVKKQYQKLFKELTLKQIINDRSKLKYHLPRMDINSFSCGNREEFAYEYGYFKGDGHIANKKKNPYVNANIYGKDKNLPMRSRDVSSIMFTKNGIEYKEVTFDDLDLKLSTKMKNELPDEVFTWNKDSILRFIAGWLDADGSNASKGVRLYGRENDIRKAQLLLTKVGIRSSVNLMQKKGVKTNLCVRKNDVWYLQITRTCDIPSKRLICNNTENARFKGKYQYIKSITKLKGKHDTFCLEEKELHQCLFNNVLTKQCNLSSINGALIKSLEDFEKASWAASILGTLQAAYTDFDYLGSVSEEITREESLLGVSITGIMDSPKILLDPDNQRKCAKIVVDTNKEFSQIIGITQAARTTCVKPEGTSSLVLKSASGIHPHHARKYFRRVQVNKMEIPYRFFKKLNQHVCEQSVWSATKTDDIITFPVEIDDKAMIKSDLSAIQHLELVRSTYKNWVVPGTTEVNKLPITHSVSITVIVKKDEWDKVTEYLFENKDSFAAVSFIPETGDKDYPQPPLEAVVTEEDEKKWKELKDHFVQIDYTDMKETKDETELVKEISCAGGRCELP